MKTLVTGGAGFIGSHLSKLLSQNNEVLIIDDLSTGDQKNIYESLRSKRVRFIKESILNKKKMAEYIKNCDAIYHLAAAVGVDYVIKNPNKIKAVNFDGCEVIFSLASKYRKSVFFSSSSEIYSNLLVGALSESQKDSSINEISNYGKSKRAGEKLAQYFYESENLKIVVARYFNVIGPNQSDKYGMVVPRFIRQANSEEPITIFGDGKQTRSFIDVRDLVIATKMIMNTESAIGQIVNIGNDQEITIHYLANQIQTLSNSNSKIIMIPYDKTIRKNYINSTNRKPDVKKIKHLIDWKPKYSLTESLTNILQSTGQHK